MRRLVHTLLQSSPLSNRKKRRLAYTPSVERLDERCLLSVGFSQTNLLSDVPGLAAYTRPQLDQPLGHFERPLRPFLACRQRRRLLDHERRGRSARALWGASRGYTAGSRQSVKPRQPYRDRVQLQHGVCHRRRQEFRAQPVFVCHRGRHHRGLELPGRWGPRRGCRRQFRGIWTRRSCVYGPGHRERRPANILVRGQLSHRRH